MPETQGPDTLPGILATIVRTKREELAVLRERSTEVERAAREAGPLRDFGAALRRSGEVALIAECKRRSPGAGEIRPGLDPAALVSGYESAGAAAASVLTDQEYFGGGLDDLAEVRSRVAIPLLRKDFTLDTLHVFEARAGGADAVLLIVRILDDATLTRLHREIVALGMTALVEVHHVEELERALAAGARVLGINNRDLSTFTTELDTTLRLLEQVPDDVVVVSESGIRTRADVERLGSAGVDAILVGESLLSADDPTDAARTLAGVPRSVRGPS